jgi:hypothetical protein
MARGTTAAPILIGALLMSAGDRIAGAQSTPASASAKCSDPGYRQFDFWIGEWDVMTPDGKRAGSNSIRRIHGGCVIEERWQGATGSTGTSLNIYTPATGEWHQTWVDNDGLLLRLDGRFDGAMTLTGETIGRGGARTSHRLTFTPQPGGGLKQRWESSTGGQPWQVVFDGLYVRKGGAPSS